MLTFKSTLPFGHFQVLALIQEVSRWCGTNDPIDDSVLVGEDRLTVPVHGSDGAGAMEELCVCGTEAIVRVGLGVGERLSPVFALCTVRSCFTILKCLLWWENAKNGQQNIFFLNCKCNKWWCLWMTNSHYDSSAQGSFKMCGLLLWLREQCVWCAGDAKAEVYGWRRFKKILWNTVCLRFNASLLALEILALLMGCAWHPCKTTLSEGDLP